MIKKYMKIKFKSDDNLPFNKTLEIPNMTIVIRAIFMKIKNKKQYIMIQLTFLKELMLMKPAHQKSVMFVTIGIS